jgi:hypothetical protein
LFVGHKRSGEKTFRLFERHKRTGERSFRLFSRYKGVFVPARAFLCKGRCYLSCSRNDEVF